MGIGYFFGRPLKLALLLGFAMAAAACTKPTPYAPAAADAYGYSEQKLEDNRYRVMFAGNSVTDRSTVDNYMLFRAAELTLEKGYDYFEVVNSETDTATTYYNSGPDVGVFSGRYGGGWGWGWGVGTSFGTSTPVQRFTAVSIILLYRGERPADNGNLYNAREVQQSLKDEIVRPPPPSTA